MSTPGPLKSVAWAAAGAALLGGGMLLGFVSALLSRKYAPSPDAVEPGLQAVPKPQSIQRIEELAMAVADLQGRVEVTSAAGPGVVGEKLSEVTARVEQLEQRVEQLSTETQSMPGIDEVLAAVEHMVADRIGGLDERLSDQLRAIELLRNASLETDALLQRLIGSVESLAKEIGREGRETGRLESQKDYPIA